METIVRWTEPPSRCDYGRDHICRCEYMRVAALDPDEYMTYLLAGWRRFGHTVFRHNCSGPDACRSLRVDVARFRPDRSQRRTRKANEGTVHLRIGTPAVTPEKVALFDRFHADRSQTKGWPVHEQTTRRSTPGSSSRIRSRLRNGAIASTACSSESATWMIWRGGCRRSISPTTRSTATARSGHGTYCPYSTGPRLSVCPTSTSAIPPRAAPRCNTRRGFDRIRASIPTVNGVTRALNLRLLWLDRPLRSTIRGSHEGSARYRAWHKDHGIRACEQLDCNRLAIRMTSEENTEKTDARVLAVSQEVAALTGTALEEISRAATIEELEKLRVTYLGKQSKIMLLSKELGKVPAELRPAFGEAVNAGKKRLQEALAERKASMDPTGRRAKNAIDVTLPGIRKGAGRRHPLHADHGGCQDSAPGYGFSL